MIKIIRIIAALVVLASPVAAQVVQIQPGQVLGNSTAARALAQPAWITAMLDRALTGGTAQGAVATRNATVWVGLAPGTAGLPLLSGGAGANLAYGIPALAAGGTGANLTASNGGIFYSTGTVGAILSGTATAQQMLQSGASAAPAWSTSTWPATTTINRVLWSSATNVISDLATANNGVLITSSGGVPSISSTIPSATQDNITRTGTLVSGASGAGFTLALTASTVTGTLPCANHPALTSDVTTSSCVATIGINAVTNAKSAQMAAFTFKGNATGSLANATDFTVASLTQKVTPIGADLVIIADTAASNATKYATISSMVGTGAVTSIAGNTGAFTLGTGLTNSTNDIRVSLSTATNVLGGDVALNNTANYFDGPSMAQGTSGTWFASGQVTVLDASSATINCKLWDGTTVIASSASAYAAAFPGVVHLAGYLASPAANIRISCRDVSNTTGNIKFNSSGNSKDAAIFGIRIAP